MHDEQRAVDAWHKLGADKHVQARRPRTPPGIEHPHACGRTSNRCHKLCLYVSLLSVCGVSSTGLENGCLRAAVNSTAAVLPQLQWCACVPQRNDTGRQQRPTRQTFAIDREVSFAHERLRLQGCKAAPDMRGLCRMQPARPRVRAARSTLGPLPTLCPYSTMSSGDRLYLRPPHCT